MSDDSSEREDDPASGDLDTGLRNRLRDVRAGGRDLTRSEVLELAEAITRQRQEMAGALADLARREDEAAAVREALERTSREAAQALDERDARLSALASELELERAWLDQRARDLDAAERDLAARVEERAEGEQVQPGRLAGLEGVVSELRDRLDRVEAALAMRVRTVPEVVLGPFQDRNDLVARALELVAELARVLRSLLDKLISEGVSAGPDHPGASLEEATAPEEIATAHVLFVSTVAGYRFFERDGPGPLPGERLTLHELGGAEATVTGLRHSPLPSDLRRCIACVVERREVSPGAETVPALS